MAEEYEKESKKCNGMNVVKHVAQEYVKMAPAVDTAPEVPTEKVVYRRGYCASCR